MTAQDKIWKVIRSISSFTIYEIVELTGLPYKHISVYMAVLSRSGYVRKIGLRKERPGSAPRSKLWQLVKNTGPKAPLIRHCLLDRNLNELTEVKDCVKVD